MLVPKDERILLQHYTHQNIEKMIVHKHVKTKGSPSAWSSHLNWDMGKSISRQHYPFSYSNLEPLAPQIGRLPLHQALLSQAFWCSQLHATILIKKYVNLTLSIQEHFSLVAWLDTVIDMCQPHLILLLIYFHSTSATIWAVHSLNIQVENSNSIVCLYFSPGSTTTDGKFGWLIALGNPWVSKHTPACFS